MRFIGFIKNGKPIMKPVGDSVSDELIAAGINSPTNVDQGTCIVEIKILGYADGKMCAEVAATIGHVSKHEIDNTIKLFSDNGFYIARLGCVDFFHDVDIKLVKKLVDREEHFIYILNSFLENPEEIPTNTIYKSIVALRMAAAEISEKDYPVNLLKSLRINDSGKLRTKPCITIGGESWAVDEIFSEFMKMHTK